MYLILPLMFIPWFMILAEGDPNRWFDNPLPWILVGAGFIVFMLVSYGVAPLIRSALIVGALKAERGAGKVSFREIFSDGRAFYLRLLGLMLLYALITMLVMSLVFAIQTIGNILTMGLASLCLMPLTFLMYPLMFATLAWMELAESAIVVDGLGVMDAVRRAWEILRSNKMNIFIIALIIYLGVGMVTSLVIMPFFPAHVLCALHPAMGARGNFKRASLGCGHWHCAFYPYPDLYSRDRHGVYENQLVVNLPAPGA